MKQETFTELPFYQKIKNLYFEGHFIVAIRYYGYKVNLYLYHNYYVEVFYNHKEDKIEKVLLLDHGCTRMKFYVDQISLGKIRLGES